MDASCREKGVFRRGSLRNVRLSRLQHSECQMHCWVLFVLLGAGLGPAEAPFAETPFSRMLPAEIWAANVQLSCCVLLVAWSATEWLLLRAPRCGPGPNCLLEAPPTPRQLQDPSLQPQPVPPHPPSLSPPPPWLFLQSFGRGRLAQWAGLGEAARGGGWGRALQAALGARHTSGDFRSCF